MTRVIVLGNAAYDHVFEVPALPKGGSKASATLYRQTGGGIAATAAVAIAAVGGEALYWGRLGCDPVGDVLVQSMRSCGVDTSSVRRIEGASSAVACVIVDSNGERQIATFPGSGLDTDPSWLPLEDLDRARAVMIDFRWLAGAERLAAEARERGIPIVLDVDAGAQSGVERLLSLATHAIFSAQYLSETSGCADLGDGLRRMQHSVQGLVGVTAGANGFYWLDERGQIQHEPGFAVAVLDTTGAGDVFHGIFALALAEGQHVRSAARIANAAAALKCQNGRGWAGMPARASVEALLQGLGAPR